MAAGKYLKQVAGQITEVQANDSSAGASDAGKMVALDASGKLAESMMPPGISAEVKVLVASEALAARSLVNIWSDSGTEKARKADASNGRRANGFVLAAVDLGANATVYLEGTITGLTSKTPGAPQFLSADSAGAMVETPDATSGEISQEVGVAVSATEVSFEPQQPITLA